MIEEFSELRIEDRVNAVRLNMFTLFRSSCQGFVPQPALVIRLISLKIFFVNRNNFKRQFLKL